MMNRQLLGNHNIARDGAYVDGRRPEDVEFGDDIIEDLARRDFTINAMALDL